MYVKGRMPFTQIVETAPSQVSTPNKIPSHAYISDTPNHLSQQAHSRILLDMSQVTAWDGGPSDLQPTLAWTCFPRELVLGSCTYLRPA